MRSHPKPIVDQWYGHLDKGQRFYVTAVDEGAGTVEVQHFDGDVDEFDLGEWFSLDIEPIEPPEDWTGPVDDIERDDLGYSETDMSESEWAEPLSEQGDASVQEEEAVAPEEAEE
jgi:Family of unknown function (DUF6763)